MTQGLVIREVFPHLDARMGAIEPVVENLKQETQALRREQGTNLRGVIGILLATFIPM